MAMKFCLALFRSEVDIEPYRTQFFSYLFAKHKLSLLSVSAESHLTTLYQKKGRI